LTADKAYAELGLAPGASEAEVKMAWRRLASRWHPDRNNSAGAIAKMQRINEALAQIREATSGFAGDTSAAGARRAAADRDEAPPSPARRGRGAHEHDRDGASGGSGQANGRGTGQRHGADDEARSSGNGEAHGADDEADGPSDGGYGSSDEAHGGHDEPYDAAAGDTDEPAKTNSHERTIARKVKLSLEEAAAGCVKTLRGRFVDRCSACAGVGHRVLPGVCAGCDGKGTVSHRAWFGWYGVPTTCTACRGDGVAREDCHVCAGAGKLPARAYRVNVRIPHGVREGDQLHVGARRHRAGHAAVSLDLTIELLVHPLLKLDEDGTIRCEMPVDGFVWIANRLVDVPTLGGLHKLRMSRDELVYRLPGLGYPAERRGARADQVVTLRPVFAAQFSADQNILLDQLIATNSGGAALGPELGGWRDALLAWQQGHARTHGRG
jgi:molecular chaperone DnaJ